MPRFLPVEVIGGVIPMRGTEPAGGPSIVSSTPPLDVNDQLVESLAVVIARLVLGVPSARTILRRTGPAILG